jgi:hypothetical protein
MSIESAKVVSLKTAEQPTIRLDTATVAPAVSASGLADVYITLQGDVYPAKVSFSCLVQPNVDDVVLLAGDAESGYYILSILERPGAQDMTLAFPASTSLHNLNGSMNILSSQSVSFAAQKLSMIAENSVHRSKKAYVDYDQLTAKGHDAVLNFGSVRVISNLINTIAKQAIQKFHGYIRHTESADQIKAGQMSRTVEGLYSMDSKYTIMVSKKDTKIDGEHIHMG